MHKKIEDVLIRAASTLETASARIKGQRALKSMATASEPALRARSAAGWRLWEEYRAPGGIEAQRRAAVRRLTLCFLCGYGEFPAPLVPELAEAVKDTTQSMLRAIAKDSLNEPVTKAVVLDVLIDLLQRCVNASAQPTDQRNALNTLSTACFLQYHYAGARAALDNAVEACRATVELCTDDPTLTQQLFRYALMLGARSRDAETAEVRRDLDSAVVVLRRALVLVERTGDPDGEARVLDMLCEMLRYRFMHFSVEADLEEAIAAGFSAIALKGDSPDAYDVLPGVLRVRYHHTGTRAALDEYVHYSTVAAVTPQGHKFYPSSRVQYAAALLDRFQHLGTEKDLDEAVVVLRQAVAATSKSDQERGLLLSNLGVAMVHRYNLNGAEADIDGAIEFHRMSVLETLHGLSERGRFRTNLSVALSIRFIRWHDRSDIDEAVLVAREAVDLTSPSLADFPGYLANLGARLTQRFTHTKAEADLAEAIATLTKAADLVAADAPVRLAVLEALNMARLDQFDITADLTTVDGVIEELTTMSRALPTEHHRRGMVLARLGQATRSRFLAVGRGQDGLAAEKWFEQAGAATALSPVVRIHAWTTAAKLAVERGDLATAATRFEHAVLLLPVMASRRLHQHDQQFYLAAYPGVAAAAATLMLRTEDDPDRALAVLELGRGVLLSQALNTRDDVTDLREQHLALAQRYERLRDLLDADIDQLSVRVPETAVWLRERVAGDRQRATEAFDSVLAEIRVLPGFRDFGRPPDPARLRPPRGAGTVVLLNVSEYGSDALLVTADGVDHVPLPLLTAEAVETRGRELREATETRSRPDTTDVEYVAAEAVLPSVLSWLWDAVAEPVLNAIGATKTPETEDAWPHVWWVLGAPMALLPMHAAGHHGERVERGARRTVMDRVISSYTPTVRAVSHAYRSEVPNQVVRHSLIVAVPDDLPHVLEEAETLSQLLPDVSVLLSGPRPRSMSRRIVKGRPTAEAIRASLTKVEIAHFACHGVTDPANPSQNGLVLKNTANLFTVSDFSTIRSAKGRLAYLSACSTARNDAHALADESIHLVSACQLAGFTHVLGTLWPVGDIAAQAVAKEFYIGLRTDSGQLDLNRAAEVLHRITRNRRNRGSSVWTWAAYLHAGRGPT